MAKKRKAEVIQRWLDNVQNPEPAAVSENDRPKKKQRVAAPSQPANPPPPPPTTAPPPAPPTAPAPVLPPTAPATFPALPFPPVGKAPVAWLDEQLTNSLAEAEDKLDLAALGHLVIHSDGSNRDKHESQRGDGHQDNVWACAVMFKRDNQWKQRMYCTIELTGNVAEAELFGVMKALQLGLAMAPTANFQSVVICTDSSGVLEFIQKQWNDTGRRTASTNPMKIIRNYFVAVINSYLQQFLQYTKVLVCWITRKSPAIGHQMADEMCSLTTLLLKHEGNDFLRQYPTSATGQTNELLLDNSHTLTELVPLDYNAAVAGVSPYREQLLSICDGQLNAVLKAAPAFVKLVKRAEEAKKERENEEGEGEGEEEVEEGEEAEKGMGGSVEDPIVID